ncbi:MarR family transcriptional regulator (plasmid) [Coraliomargarita sp. W4R53]
MMGCMDDDELLALIYRSRASTITELAEVSHLDTADVATRVSRLQNRGAVTVRDGVITCPHPAAWTARVIEDQTHALRDSSAAATAKIESLVAQLPSLLGHWAVGETSGDIAPVFARHGPRAAEDLWYDTSHEKSDSAWGVLPNVERFLTTDPARAARFGAAFAGKQSVRALVPKSV